MQGLGRGGGSDVPVIFHCAQQSSPSLTSAESAALSRRWVGSCPRPHPLRPQCVVTVKGQQRALLYVRVKDVHLSLLWLFSNDT